MSNPRKPDEIKKLEGTYREDRANPDAPVYRAAPPPMPDWLSVPAAAEWCRHVPLLAEKRVLAETDLGVLAAYCSAVGDQQLANETLKHSPRFYESEGGLWKEHPAAKASRDAGQQVRMLANELGLSPASRSKVSPLPEAPEKDPMEAPAPKRRAAVN
jgi:P27 family predicted phage terminase small subunit